jgi:hypothetical protein
MAEKVIMRRYRFGCLIILPLIVGITFLTEHSGFAENIDPDNDASQYLYSENVGWLNAESNGDGGPGIEVDDLKLTGYVWSENLGWINLNPTHYGGVTNDGEGNLGGYAWSENAGWINFAPTGSGVKIDPVSGEFSGMAWGENIGWISFRGEGSIPFRIVTSWTPSGMNQCESDFNGDGDVDGTDLHWYISNSGGLGLEVFADNFGNENCP